MVNAVGGGIPSLRELLQDCVPALGFFGDYRPSLVSPLGGVVADHA